MMRNELFFESWVEVVKAKLADDGMASPDPIGDWLLSQVEGLVLFCRRYPLVSSALEEAYDPRLNHMLQGGYGLVNGGQYRRATQIRPDCEAAGAITAVAQMLGEDCRLEELVSVTWSVAVLLYDWNTLFAEHDTKEAH